MACTSDCLENVCGDGEIGPGEACDDGNTDETDACLNACVAASCGDGHVYGAREECDEGPLNSDTTMCTASCKLATCGDGLVLDGVEDCDDGNLDDFDTCTSICTNIQAPELQLSFSQVKQFEFSWAAVLGAEYYQLHESADGMIPFVQVGGDIMGESVALTMPLHFRIHARYKLLACKGDVCIESPEVEVVSTLAAAVGYFKASNTGINDEFGVSVALSEDGNTLAVGAPREDSAATGIDGDQANDGATNGGAVYVFVRNGGTWSQQAYVKASNTDIGSVFGWRVALSADGNTLAVGARSEDSNATGVGGDQENNDAVGSGAVYVFVRNRGVWSQQAYVKASNTGADDGFGTSVALSGDGNTLAVGARWEDSSATGIDGDQASDADKDSGAAYVFVRTGGVWSQQAYVKASNTDVNDGFGVSLALSGDGNTLAVGAYFEDSGATGIDGDQANHDAANSGAIYVFVRTGGVWSQQAYVKASNTETLDRFGENVALSGDGNTLAVAAPDEDSTATGIDGDQGNSSFMSGAVYVFVRNGESWSQQAYVKASNTNSGDNFGSGVALSEDGNVLAVGARGESSDATGIGGNQASDTNENSGATYVFVRDGGIWSQQAYVKASNTDSGDAFGINVALSGDGNTVAVAAAVERSNATGVGGDQANNLASGSGAVYLY
ncbi:MAG: DUF4215 domain-containing protein [Deltaproteobacteria bacterium]|nr:DUF4215 domain-containing protein [Deltaproteobacteria bacterium]